MSSVQIVRTRQTVDWLQPLNILYTCSQSNSGGSVRVRLATSISYDTLMKNCFKDWSQSRKTAVHKRLGQLEKVNMVKRGNGHCLNYGHS